MITTILEQNGHSLKPPRIDSAVTHTQIFGDYHRRKLNQYEASFFSLAYANHMSIS